MVDITQPITQPEIQSWWNQPLIVALATVLLTAVLGVIPRTRRYILNALKRFWYRHFPGDLNIALSIQSSGTQSQTYCDEVKQRMINAISQFGLNGVIHVKDISNAVTFSEQVQAQNFGIAHAIDLIIWGKVSGDGLETQGIQANDFLLNFTFTHPENHKSQIGKMILTDVNSKLAQKNYWTVIKQDSLRDVRIIASNLTAIALYILGVTLKVQGRLVKAIEVFERLHAQLDSTNDAFQIHARVHLINCYHIAATDLYFSKKYKEAVEISRKVVALDEKNLSAIANTAISLFRDGDTDGAKLMAKKLLEYYPSQPLARVDFAFFCILEKRFTKADQLYKQLSKIDTEKLGYNPVEVVDFLEENFKTLHEPALRYASGMTAFYHLQDKKLAEQDLRDFIHLVRDQRQYKKMVTTAKRVLETNIA